MARIKKEGNKYATQVRAIQNASYGYSLVRELTEVSVEVASGGVNELLTSDLDESQRLLVNGATTTILTLAKAAVPNNKRNLKELLGGARSGFSTGLGRDGANKLKSYFLKNKKEKGSSEEEEEEEDSDITQREMRLDAREKELLEKQKELEKIMKRLEAQTSK